MNVDTRGFVTVSAALAAGLKIFNNSEYISLEESRNGPVAVAKGPVLIRNDEPMNRVLFSAARDANPFFHLFESLWMLGGRNDLPWLAQFNKQMATYSDDGGKTQPAAYGHRWRSFFGVDQLKVVINELRVNPGSRRAVLSMWGPANDLSVMAAGGADVPCNVNCFFTVREGNLHMSVQCRSNDMWWGAHGANAVHFSVLQEYMAACLGLGVGTMFQYAWNYHIYTDVVKGDLLKLAEEVEASDKYTHGGAVATPLFNVDNVGLFDEELPLWLAAASPAASPNAFYVFTHPTLELAYALLNAWRWHKRGDYVAAVACIPPGSGDWSVACVEWLERRRAKRKPDNSPSPTGSEIPL